MTPAANGNVAAVDIDTFDQGIRKIIPERKKLIAGRATIGKDFDRAVAVQDGLNEAKNDRIAIWLGRVEGLERPPQPREVKPHRMAEGPVEQDPPKLAGGADRKWRKIASGGIIYVLRHKFLCRSNYVPR